MVKKMKLPFIVKNKSEMRSSSSSWPWPFCHQPRTLSFRANTTDSDSPAVVEVDPIKSLVRGLRSDRRRLFFEPDDTSSILEMKASSSEGGRVPFKDSFVLSMESQDPYGDFRKSMEEMVEAHALKHLEALQELLCWYLRVNAKSNHVCILAAFVDLLVGLSPSSPSPCPSYSSPLSFSTSSLSSSFGTRCVNDSSLEAEEEVDATDQASTSASSLSQQVKEGDIEPHEDEASSLNA